MSHPMRIIWAVYKHPKGRPRCLVFDQSFEFARFYAVKTKASENAYVHDVCPHPFRRA